MSYQAGSADRTSLRRFLLTGRGESAAIAEQLARRHAQRSGLGVAVYEDGKQLACRVSLSPPDARSITRLLELVRAEIPAGAQRPVILLSLLDRPRIVSIDEYEAHGVRIGFETVAAIRRGGVALILAHVPCLMSWNSRQLGRALVQKQGGGRLLELHVFPTETVWLGDDGTLLPCRGGLQERSVDVETRRAIRDEIAMVTGYLAGQLSATTAIDYGYDPWRDRGVHVDSVARKAVAIAALVRGAGVLGDGRVGARGRDALAQLIARRKPAGDIDDAHLLLAGASGIGLEAIERLCGTFGESGAIVAHGRRDQEYFPGVALAALAPLRVLQGTQYARCLAHYRLQFRAQPTWPALWWQLRAWSTIARLEEGLAFDFICELAEWALVQQLPSGAFDTWSWPVAPSFQTVCVVEGVLGAAAAARQVGEPRRAERYLAAARRGLRFASSLVLDTRHADLLPRPSRAIGGVRSWHGELLLRADAAGHYLTALMELEALDHPGVAMAERSARQT